MKRIRFIQLLCVLAILTGCKEEKTLPRVAIVGVGVECSTFSPAKTTFDMFRPKYGEDIINSYSFFKEDTTLIKRAEWFPTMLAWATPGGIVTRECYDTIVNRSLRMLKENMPYDGIYLDIHGAMSVEGLPDPEGDYAAKIREVVGDDVILSASMDLHGCVSRKLAENLDMISAYRMAPHTDKWITRHRVITDMLYRLENNMGKPAYKAWVKVPILLPGEKTSTRVEPGKSLYAEIDSVLINEGVIDASIWMSYPWADEPRNHGVVFVYGDNKENVEAGALRLAEKFWSYHDQFEFVAPTATLEEVLAKALKSDKKPYFISDMGDNPTAGGAGDVTWTLDRLLKRPEFQKANGKRIIYASIPGPEFVQKAKKAGIGKIVSGMVGAEVDNRYCGPVELSGRIEAIYDNGKNAQVVVRTGSMQVIVSEIRTPYHYRDQFEKLNLDPMNADIIVVKLGYLTEELYEMSKSGDWMMAHTRGGVDQELTEIPYQHLERPIYPLDPDMEDPQLKVEFIK